MPKRVELLLSLVLLGHIAFAQDYKAIPLKSLGKGSPQDGLTVALGVNDSGIVVGTSELPDNSRHACYWSQNGVVTDLGTLGGTYGVGYAINNLRQVAGTSSVAGDTRSDPFLWTSTGGMQDLGRLGSGHQNEAHAINDSTQVAGFSCLTSLICHAFLWTQAAGMQDLGTLGGKFSMANGINSLGHVTGWSERTDGTRHGFLWTAQTGMQEIAPGVSFENFPFSINDSDQIVGQFFDTTDNEYHAFSWTQATGIQDLGTLESGWSAAASINNSGDIVGFGRNAAQTDGFELIWRPGQAIQKLAPLAGVTLNEAATSISNAGQIAANGFKPYLLRPTWVKLSPKTLNFGSWLVGGTSTVMTATLTNLGSTPLTIGGISIAGMDRGDFAQNNTCGSSLAAGATCAIHVTFSPTATGTRTAVIKVADSDWTSPQKVTLTGTGN